MRSISLNSLSFIFFGLVYTPNGWLLDLWGSDDLLIERLYFLLLITAGLYSIAINQVSSKAFNWMLVFYSTLGVSLCANLINIVIDKPETIGDFASEWARYAACFGIAHFIYFTANSDLNSMCLEKTVVRLIRYIVYGQFLFFLIFISPLGDYLDGLYLTKSILNVKFDGTLSNPNYFAYTFSLFYFLTWWYRHFFSKFEFVLICVVILFLTIMTGSKTGFIVICIQSFLYFPFLSVVITIILLPFTEEVMSVNVRIYHIYDYLINGTSLESFDERHEIVLRSLQSISDNPLFGQAIRDGSNNIVDNYYIGHLLRYGIVGSAVQLLVVCALIFRCIRNVQIFFYASPTIILYMYTGEFLDNFRLYFFTALVLILAGASTFGLFKRSKIHHIKSELSF